MESDIIVWIDSKPFHPGDEGGSADSQAHRGAVRTSNTPFAIGQRLNDLITLSLCVVVLSASAFEGSNRFLDDPRNVVFRRWNSRLHRFLLLSACEVLTAGLRAIYRG